MSNSAMNLDSNVTIRTINKYGSVTSSRCIHNKATYYMVEGLLRFLKGDFNDSPNESLSYQPSRSGGVVRFGNIGVHISEDSNGINRLDSINSGEFKIPTFDDYKLQQDIGVFDSDIVPIMSITTYDDPNNSAGLLIKVAYPPGYLVNKEVNNSTSNPWVYIDSNGRKSAVITELGLTSGSYLLARVLLNGSIHRIIQDTDGSLIEYEDDNNPRNPLVQDEDSSLIVEWRIGLVALGQNDVVSTYVNSFNPNITGQSIPYTINSDRTIVTRKVNIDGELQTWYYYVVFKIVDDKPKINSTLFKITDSEGNEKPLPSDNGGSTSNE